MLILGAATAGIMAAATTASAAPAGDVKVAMGECHGINSCKGKGQCGGPGTGHECGGKNACKGQGWVRLSKADCATKKGTWEKFKMEM
jgi:hypothetical protein